MYNALPPSLGVQIRRLTRLRKLDWLAPPFRIVSDVAMRPSRTELDPFDAILLHALDVTTLPGFLHYEDRNSMTFGVETRLPFLDFRLAEMLLQLAPADKVAAGKTKALLRKAVRGIVPDQIRNRLVKTGYPAPLDQWLRERNEELRETATRRDCPFIEYGAWNAYLEAFLRGSDRHLEATWRGFVLARWYDKFFVRHEPA